MTITPESLLPASAFPISWRIAAEKDFLQKWHERHGTRYLPDDPELIKQAARAVLDQPGGEA